MPCNMVKGTLRPRTILRKSLSVDRKFNLILYTIENNVRRSLSHLISTRDCIVLYVR